MRSECLSWEETVVVTRRDIKQIVRIKQKRIERWNKKDALMNSCIK